MSDTPESLAQQIAALEAALDLPGLPTAARTPLERQLRTLRAQHDQPPAVPAGTVAVSGTGSIAASRSASTWARSSTAAIRLRTSSVGWAGISTRSQTSCTTCRCAASTSV